MIITRIVFISGIYVIEGEVANDMNILVDCIKFFSKY